MVVQVLRREQSEHPSSLNLSMPDVGLQSTCESTVGLQRLPEAGLDRRCAIFDVKARKRARPQISGKSFYLLQYRGGPLPCVAAEAGAAQTASYPVRAISTPVSSSNAYR